MDREANTSLIQIQTLTITEVNVNTQLKVNQDSTRLNRLKEKHILWATLLNRHIRKTPIFSYRYIYVRDP